jgi:formylglycine-generating enzyme required for sulfatase activity
VYRDVAYSFGLSEQFGGYEPAAIVFIDENKGKIRVKQLPVEPIYLTFTYTIHGDIITIIAGDTTATCEFAFDGRNLTLYQFSIFGKPTDMKFQKVLDPVTIFFQHGGYTLAPEAKELLDFAVPELGSVYAKFRIEGHTDVTGTDEENLAMGMRRARAVYDYLAGKGVPRQTMEYRSLGKLMPKYLVSEEGNARNRRVEIHPISYASVPQTHSNSIGMEFVLIPAGEFLMGSDMGKDPDAWNVETPQHRVSISRPLYLGTYEVTQAQWTAVMGSNPSRFNGPDNPVEQVSWHDAQEFIKRLNSKEGHSRYRLPTEAEWEYAARAGTTTRYSFGDDAGQLGQYAWYEDNSGPSTHPVGQKKPNPWGLYDMHGNVLEWVQDWYGDRYYSNSPGTDPKGPSAGSGRVLRGGGSGGADVLCRSACRERFTPDNRMNVVGFRLALDPE